MILYTVLEVALFTTTVRIKYDDYRNHTSIIGTTKQSQRYVFFRKFDVFHGNNGCDCENKTYSICYVLKYSEIVFPDTSNPLKLIGTTTNCTSIGTFTLYRVFQVSFECKHCYSPRAKCCSTSIWHFISIIINFNFYSMIFNTT